jgi:hypothetical protein
VDAMDAALIGQAIDWLRMRARSAGRSRGG